ncbi:MAG: ATP-binding cassette domain-containing protein [Acidobacteriaceae bacterium]|nr:ATP-binding cassette domain-containing protein [Acidobacteriaceae bacterium]MBV9780713.1 ATP-binding cassette domain-containing protein [Acidobacteriaceae bacterium]
MSIEARLIKRFPGDRESEPFELNVRFQAGPGITVLLGPSGAGKTLTLNCLAGFARPDDGRILVNNELYFDAGTNVYLPPQRRRCGYIFQDHALFPHMTIRENLRFAAAVAPLDKAGRLNRHRRINELLETFELSDLAARKPAQLSGGQKQRAALARVLAGEPRVLLLDEPTRGLEARLRRAFYEVIRKTRERLNAPLLLVTHDLEECFELADTVFLMARGHFLQSGPREAVLARPATTDLARSLGVYNVIEAEISALDPARNTSHLRVLNQDIDGPYLPGHLIGDRGFLCVRQAEMKVLSPYASGVQNQLTLRVLGSSPSSHGVRLTFEHDVVAIISEREYDKLRGADTLRIEVPRSAVYFIGNG